MKQKIQLFKLVTRNVKFCYFSNAPNTTHSAFGMVLIYKKNSFSLQDCIGMSSDEIPEENWYCSEPCQKKAENMAEVLGNPGTLETGPTVFFLKASSEICHSGTSLNSR